MDVLHLLEDFLKDKDPTWDISRTPSNSRYLDFFHKKWRQAAENLGVNPWIGVSGFKEGDAVTLYPNLVEANLTKDHATSYIANRYYLKLNPADPEFLQKVLEWFNNVQTNYIRFTELYGFDE